MALDQITSRDAVLDAIDDYEDIGAANFVAQHGVGFPQNLMIEYVGQKFPAMAILAATHRTVVGEPLTPDEVPSEAAAQRVLEKLGFRVIGAVEPVPRRRTAGSAAPRSKSSTTRRSASQPATPARPVIRLADWSVETGDLLTRQELTSKFGISKHATIDHSPRARSVFLFAPLLAGVDGWTPDSSAYRVIADGRRGDQTMNEVNQSVLTAADRALTLRVFEDVDEPWRPGGKRVRYVGSFHVDPETPFTHESTPDADGRDRSAIVFRLLPDDTTAEGPHESAAAPSADE